MTKEQETLVEKNHGLIYEMLGQMEVSVEDFYGVAAIALCDAAISYQGVSSIPFELYARNAIVEAVKHEKEELAGYMLEGRLSLERSDEARSHYVFEERPYTRHAAEMALARLSREDRAMLLLYSRGYSEDEVCERLACECCDIAEVVREFLYEFVQGVQKDDFPEMPFVRQYIWGRLRDSVIAGDKLVQALQGILQ